MRYLKISLIKFKQYTWVGGMEAMMIQMKIRDLIVARHLNPLQQQDNADQIQMIRTFWFAKI